MNSLETDDDMVWNFVAGVVLVPIVLVGVLGAALFDLTVAGIGRAVRAWRERRELQTLGGQHLRVIESRNAAIHDVIAIRRATERHMQELARSNAIDADAYWEE